VLLVGASHVIAYLISLVVACRRDRHCITAARNRTS